MLKRLRAQGITILVSTPYMDEATRCDEIALIQNGKILSINTPEQMVESFPEKLYALSSGNTYQLLKALENYEGVARSYAFGDHLHVVFTKDNSNTERVKSYCASVGLPDVQIAEITPSIEDCFIQYLSN